ncbi:conserved protein of unknown function [Sterolibacterium denitrificans]|uniref:DUF2863 domain-containing protein n=1 Tax=Sterolibacterium denitrificans TaxID=157592 RepID=A0A7Z7HRV9_9PROT|nr:DUF2863 family protein [Sterolibacterium denitrificans]SMB28334.1 conserved protein of unknown function [Sterolibacterium denitrificans]
MKRNRLPRQTRQTPDFDELIRLANGLGHSCCRNEDAHWEARLARRIDHLLEDGDEATLTAALDHLYAAKGPAYDALAEMIETRCESRPAVAPAAAKNVPAAAFSPPGTSLVLFNAPLLAWSRYAIPFGSISAAVLASLRVQLQAHVFAEGVQLALADYLFSPDQLPQSYCETAQLAGRLGECAMHGRDLNLDPAQLPETASFLSDTRYLLGVAAVASGAALFRWQEDDAGSERGEVLRRWQTQGGEALRPLLPGCASELLLPQSYHTACRNADRSSRPYSLRASVSYLGSMLDIAANQLRAVIAPFYEQQLEEYRIGFTLQNSNQVIHGVVWALLDAEDDNTDIPAQIETLLREIGIGEILQLDHRLPLEYCDDCGSPLYPDPEGEPVHAEMPEDQIEVLPRHLH